MVQGLKDPPRIICFKDKIDTETLFSTTNYALSGTFFVTWVKTGTRTVPEAL